jgi:hypothetical protein
MKKRISHYYLSCSPPNCGQATLEKEKKFIHVKITLQLAMKLGVHGINDGSLSLKGMRAAN